MAHSGRGRSMSELEGSGLEETMKTVRDFPNVYLETCGSGLHNGASSIRSGRAGRIGSCSGQTCLCWTLPNSWPR